MKKLLLSILTTLMLAGMLCAATNPVLSANNDASQVVRASGDGSPMPTCAPGKKCGNDQFQLRAGDGSPMPTCAPGKKCGNDQFQLRAGDGSPMPTCAPGKKCGNDQLQLRAGDGSPMPTCAPGKKCGNDQPGAPHIGKRNNEAPPPNLSRNRCLVGAIRNLFKDFSLISFLCPMSFNSDRTVSNLNFSLTSRQAKLTYAPTRVRASSCQSPYMRKLTISQARKSFFLFISG